VSDRAECDLAGPDVLVPDPLFLIGGRDHPVPPFIDAHVVDVAPAVEEHEVTGSRPRMRDAAESEVLVLGGARDRLAEMVIQVMCQARAVKSCLWRVSAVPVPVPVPADEYPGISRDVMIQAYGVRRHDGLDGN
jgi:hypothetical protein